MIVSRRTIVHLLGGMTLNQLIAQWRILLGLVLPIIAASAAEISLSFVDTAIVGRLGANQLAAVASAAALYTLVIEVVAAAAIGYQIVAAQRFGAEDTEGVSAALAHAAVVALALATVFAALLWFARPIMGLIADDPKVADAAAEWLRYRSPGLLFFSLEILLVMTLQAARHTRWVMYSAFFSTSLNAILAFFLVFGVGPFPRLGINGSAIASVIATLTSLVVLGWVVVRVKPMPLIAPKWRRGEFAQILQLSSPEMTNSMLDYLGNFVFFAVMGLLGTLALAGGRIGFIILSIVFFVALNFGVGIQILMGHSVGSNNYDEARRLLKSGRLLTLGLLAVVGSILVAWPQLVARVFTTDDDVVRAATGAIIVVGLSAPLMAWTTSHVGALRAFGETRWVLYVNIAAVWLVQIPVGLLLAIQLNWGLTGLYLGYLVYFLVRSLIVQHLSTLAFVRAVPGPNALNSGT